MSPIGPKRTFVFAPRMSALGVKLISIVAAHMSAFDPSRTLAFFSLWARRVI